MTTIVSLDDASFIHTQVESFSSSILSYYPPLLLIFFPLVFVMSNFLMILDD